MVEAPATFRPRPNASRAEVTEWNKHMHEWLSDELGEQIEREFLHRKAVSKMEFAIMRARHGDPSMLRNMHPEFADCISAPKLGRGKKYPKQKLFNRNKPAETMAKDAALMARRIRALWLRQFGKANRSQGQGEKSAEQWATEILCDWSGLEGHELPLAKVVEAAKRLTRND
jgi:hypothetical protein